MRTLLRKAMGPLGLAVALTAALAVALLLLATTPRPSEAIAAFFTGAFRSRYAFGNMLASATPLIMGGLAIAIAFRASVYNLGGEGQIYASGLAAVAVGLYFPEWGGLGGRVAALTAACATGAILAGIPGLLRERLGTNELISSYLISAATILIVNHLVTNPLADPTSNLMTTASVGKDYQLLPFCHRQLSIAGSSSRWR